MCPCQTISAWINAGTRSSFPSMLWTGKIPPAGHLPISAVTDERSIMAFYKYKGKRIRASDKSLVYRFCTGTLLSLFIAVLLLLNMGQLMRTDWEHFSLLSNGLTLSPYNIITILIATGVCALVAFLYYRFRYDSFKKLLHRQKLARMILQNKWYEADTVQDSGFFTDLSAGRSREKIV